ncbi:SprA-related family protein [Pseudomonas flavescens]|uniref:SprA-related family protein n=1 Tax=Phytopseudomonas flavescens TaxID=29435 RepID=A0A1G8FYY1_9GAMM|nr:putative metalloprotease CJM1_0395 family protein [Pseudomonas flavescens]SDH87347.1 SprA-related family protein [Pseudomonas flavescens]
MQLAGFSSSYHSMMPALLSVPRPVESASSPDLARAAFAPVAPAAEADSAKTATAQEEQDQPEDASSSGKPGEQPRTTREEQVMQLEIAELANRDREVRTHEQAHAAVGGVHAGAPTYSYTRGPDGKRYASSGEVSIDVGAVANDPQATLSKMQIVIRAALAPAEPSAQDRSVASQAQAQMAVARTELAALQRSEAEGKQTPADEAGKESDDPSVTSADPEARPGSVAISLYAASAADHKPSGLLDLRV